MRGGEGVTWRVTLLLEKDGEEVFKIRVRAPGDPLLVVDAAARWAKDKIDPGWFEAAMDRREAALCAHRDSGESRAAEPAVPG